MPPTDKALAMMTPEIKELIDLVISAARQVEYEETTWRTSDYGSAAAMREANTLLLKARTALESAVDHPERLAGEDEVVVKREELQKSFEMLRDMPSSRYGNAVVTLILSWMKGWLAGSPTAQEGKEK